MVIVSGTLVLVMALGWAAYRVTAEQEPPVPPQATAPQATTAVADKPAPQQVPLQLHDELDRHAIDAAASSPAWTRESLLDRLSPFDPSVAARVPSDVPSNVLPDVPPTETARVPQDAPEEISLRLGKGDTIGSALQKLGVASDAIAAVISALQAHTSLTRLPAGLAMTAQIRPSGEAGARPLLQALTLHPEGHRAIRVERNGRGKYAVEQRSRSPGR